MQDNRQTIDVSWATIARLIIVVGAIWLLVRILDVILLGFIVAVIVAALAPVIDSWSKKMDRGLAVVLIYLLIGAVIALIGVIIIPPLASQIQDLAFTLPSLFSQFSHFIGSSLNDLSLSSQAVDSISSALQSVGSGLVSTTRSFIDGVVGVFTVLVLSFYLLLEAHGGRKLLTRLLPLENRENVALILHKIGLKMGSWLRGQLTLGLIIGIVDFLILLVAGVPYALTLGVWAAVTELIPYVGPVLGGIPAVIVALTVSPVKGLIVLVAYVVVQQIEANILVPRVMSRAVGLSPVVIIFAILIGARLAGLLGVVVAVPTAAAISVLVEEWPLLRKKIGQ